MKRDKEFKILFFSAHPDDHLCCAGTLMFLKEKGFSIQEIIATGGEKGPWWISKNKQKTGFKEEELKQERRKEIEKASRIIGIEKTVFLGLPDSKISRDLETIEEMLEIIRKNRPEIVFAMSDEDYHCDHREFSKMTLEAVEKASWNYLLEKGKPWRVPVVLLVEGFYLEKANILVDITPFKKKKDQLIRIYRSQINMREKMLLEAINFYRAFLTRDERVKSAEGFRVPSDFPIYFNRFFNIFAEKIL